MLPLGCNYVRIPYGGNDYSRKAKTVEKDQKTFDPVDASLLSQDKLGLKLVVKLKSRVKSIEQQERNPGVWTQPKASVEFMNRRLLTDSMKASMLKPIFLENVFIKAGRELRKNSGLQGLRINLTSINADRVIKNMSRCKSILDKRMTVS